MVNNTTYKPTETMTMTTTQNESARTEVRNAVKILSRMRGDMQNAQLDLMGSIPGCIGEATGCEAELKEAFSLIELAELQLNAARDAMLTWLNKN
jgi:hypothetical protein